MDEKMLRLRDDAISLIQAASTTASLEELRIRFLGKKGEVTALLKGMGALPANE
jgi:phenylalanyl-tRNA synthetase alpha chain